MPCQESTPVNPLGLWEIFTDFGFPKIKSQNFPSLGWSVGTVQSQSRRTQTTTSFGRSALLELNTVNNPIEVLCPYVILPKLPAP